jgi:hypothetical protein
MQKSFHTGHVRLSVSAIGSLSACPPSRFRRHVQAAEPELEGANFLVWFSHAARNVGQTVLPSRMTRDARGVCRIEPTAWLSLRHGSLGAVGNSSLRSHLPTPNKTRRQNCSIKIPPDNVAPICSPQSRTSRIGRDRHLRSFIKLAKLASCGGRRPDQHRLHIAWSIWRERLIRVGPPSTPSGRPRRPNAGFSAWTLVVLPEN